jgi:hypothetical protein
MKKIPILPILVAIALNLQSQHLYVLPIGGEQVAFAFEHKPKITFGNGTKTIQSTAKTETYQLANVQNLSFKFNQPTNVRDLDKHVGSPLRAWVANDVLYIAGLTIGKPYRIYSISGTLVHYGIAKSDVATWNGTRNAPTIYIIHSENQSLKIIK